VNGIDEPQAGGLAQVIDRLGVTPQFPAGSADDAQRDPFPVPLADPPLGR